MSRYQYEHIEIVELCSAMAMALAYLIRLFLCILRYFLQEYYSFIETTCSSINLPDYLYYYMKDTLNWLFLQLNCMIELFVSGWLHKANIEERYFNHGGSFHQYFLKQYPYGSILASPFNSFCLIGIEMITNHSCELTRLCYQMFTAL